MANMNILVINYFERLHLHESINGNKFKAGTCEKVLVAIKNEFVEKKRQITLKTLEELQNMKGIGKSSIDKIKEIIETKKLKIVDDLDITQDTLTFFKILSNDVYGIGPVKAKKILTEGIHSMEELDIYIKETDPKFLNKNQAKGLLYYKDTSQRIPYSEMQKHEQFILCALHKSIPGINITICGSYRRKAKNSGDIDVLISDPQGRPKILQNCIKILEKIEYIIDSYAKGVTKFMGVCRLPDSLIRRIDIVQTTIHEYPFAILYFTGSGDYNRMVRAKANEMGYTLNEHGIQPFSDGEKKEMDMKQYQLFLTKHKLDSERNIIEFLGLPYLEPHLRVIE